MVDSYQGNLVKCFAIYESVYCFRVINTGIKVTKVTRLVKVS